MIDFVGEKVTHKTMGSGTIVEQDGNYFFVEFSNKKSKFKFPDAFNGFLNADSLEIMKAAEDEIENQKKIQEEERQRRIEEEKKKEEQQLHSKEKPSQAIIGMNYAFKCNYCNGNADGGKIGFSGACSDDIIHNNIKVHHRSWCNQAECPCMQYYSGKITRAELDEQAVNGFVCYEAEMLTKWKVQAGTNTEGTKKGTARRIAELSPGKLCILTTRDPDDKSESERYIFAAFLIGACDEGDEFESGCIYAMPDYTICFNEEESKKLKFWDYHKNVNAPDKQFWGTGLYRKFGDKEAVRILDEIVAVKNGTEDQAQAEKIRDQYINRNK